MAPTVTLEHLEQAWHALMPPRPAGAPKGKARWNDQAGRDFHRDCTELATLLIDAMESDFSTPPMAHATLRLAIVMHRAFHLAGAAFAPLSRRDVLALLDAEDNWRAQTATLPPPILQQAEQDRLTAIPNHALLVSLIGFLMDTQSQAKAHALDDEAFSDLSAASHLLHISLAALNLAAARAAETPTPAV